MIVTTPNQMHEANGLECVSARLPGTVEKPFCAEVAEDEELVAAAERAGA